MSKVYIVIVVILACGWGYEHLSKVTLENDLNSLKKDYLSLEGDFEQTMQQKMYLEKKFDEQNEKILAANKRVCEIEKRAEEEKDKGNFNWDTHLPNDSVTNQLHQD